MPNTWNLVKIGSPFRGIGEKLDVRVVVVVVVAAAAATAAGARGRGLLIRRLSSLLYLIVGVWGLAIWCLGQGLGLGVRGVVRQGKGLALENVRKHIR